MCDVRPVQVQQVNWLHTHAHTTLTRTLKPRFHPQTILSGSGDQPKWDPFSKNPHFVIKHKQAHPPHTHIHTHPHTFLLLVAQRTTKWRNEEQVSCRQFLRSRVGCNYHSCETLVGCSFIITKAGVKPHHIRLRGLQCNDLQAVPEGSSLRRLNDNIPQTGICFVLFPSARRVGKY